MIAEVYDRVMKTEDIRQDFVIIVAKTITENHHERKKKNERLAFSYMIICSAGVLCCLCYLYKKETTKSKVWRPSLILYFCG